MHKSLSVLFSGAIIYLYLGQASVALAEDRIQAYVDSKGRTVFTNLIEGSPRLVFPEVEHTDILANEVPAPLRPLIDTISRHHGVDSGLVRALIKTESNFDRWAVSPKGARGLMQLMPETGRMLGVQDFFDPHQNVDAGVRYLKSLLERFGGDLDLSLAAYNAGENLVARIGSVPAYPETVEYVRRIRSMFTKNAAPVTSVALPPVAGSPAMEKPDRPLIFRAVDQRGVVRFSNIQPPN